MKSRSVLVVEDDDTSRTVLKSLFAHKGWSASGARKLAEAKEKMDPPPDYVLLDLKLPDGDGEEIHRLVEAEGLPTRVAVCSGEDDAERLVSVRRMNPVVVFRKPLSFAHVYLACVGDKD